MGGKTVEIHLDDRSVERLGAVVEAKGRSASQIVAVATRLPLDLTAHYAHMADSTLVSAADKVSACIATALDGTEEAKVVALLSKKWKA